MANNLKFINSEGIEKEDALFLNDAISIFNEKLQSSNYSVYSFTGDWGSGKTTFIKLWENSLNSSDYIHIDAFEMDYETEPFIMLIKYFYKYLKDEMKIDKPLLDDFTNKAKKIFSRSLKTVTKVVINAVASKLVGNENAKELISDFGEILFDELVITESEEASLYEKLKDVLCKITENLKNPIYVIIDELDRCRPTFALETLEKIKHIFQVKNIKFILVYNNYILESIIEKTYGISNGNKYLDKFIQKSIPISNGNHFSTWFFRELRNKKEYNNSMEIILEQLEAKNKIFSALKKSYGTTLRDFQRLFSSLFSYHRIPSPPDGDKDLHLIIIFEIMKIIDNTKYLDMKERIEISGKLEIISQDAPLLYNLQSIIGSSANPKEIKEIFKKYISGSYR